MNKIRDLSNNPCPCGKPVTLSECCLSLINSSEKAQTAEQLMRSRYTAYVLGNSQYLLDSWHPDTRPDDLQIATTVNWTGLTVLKASDVELRDKNPTAYVEFIASFTNGGAVEKMHERSRFVRQKGQWLYLDGEQFEMNSRLMEKSPGRNEPCFCGSGKKFKKCCGKNI